ncbi:helix-turn-helix transcriptional regulator [Dyella sp.]|uniref:helix-turn-helix transcriptional regulator n=1 Tax=Dyella sp. TaxID=1869338 RepID=UPI002D772FA3|nr:helix-turn-helix transcriptional regulator [Dyella sp.]HET7332991.1 helix-turn-helix transcriptional regulator [Dyella sp.]
MDAIRTPDELGSLLRAARIRQRLTQAQVASQLGVSTQAVSKLESRAGRASFDRIHRLCLLLGIAIVLQPKGTRSAKEATTRPDIEW